MTATFYVGDAIEVMGQLPEKSVDLVLTSPPFLALRSYLPADHPDKALEGGSQAIPGEYIDWLIDVVEACARVLAPHGSLCIELGDTYSSHDYGTGGDQGDGEGSNLTFKTEDGKRLRGPFRPKHYGTDWPLAKSLSLIPELFRFALVYGHNPLTGRQTERWRLRNVIRWVRPNPPVGALGDKFRPATSELMVFCKSAKRYFDLDAVRVPYSDDMQRLIDGRTIRGTQRTSDQDEGIGSDWTNRKGFVGKDAGGAPPLDWWNIPLSEDEEPTRYGPKERQRREGERSGTGPKTKNEDGTGAGWAWERTLINHPAGAPPLDWWNIPPGGYEGAHYAVWPPELCVKPIKAMCPESVCRVCGEPRRRIVEAEQFYRSTGEPTEGKRAFTTGAALAAGLESKQKGVLQALGHDSSVERRVLSQYWTDCSHDNYRPGLVLDPFAGSGTTLAVATGHGRDAIGVDLDERNYELALDRVGPLMLTRGEVAA